MTLFDRYVVVDWSASSTPKTGADSIWIADLGVDGDEPVLHNPSTRSDAFAVLAEMFDVRVRRRTLIGFDASLGHPTGTSKLFGLDGDPPWTATWRRVAELVTDDDHNRNDRFAAAACLNAATGEAAGPFWGAPTNTWAPTLRRTKPPSFGVAEFRLVERVLRSRGSHPKSCWQLFGAGSVGGQTLTLLPRLWQLRDRIAVWPLATGLRVPDVGVVVVEVWPSMFPLGPGAGRVLDAAQVSGTATAIRDADDAGDLGRWFTPSVSEPSSVRREEGWILGVDGDLPR